MVSLSCHPKNRAIFVRDRNVIPLHIAKSTIRQAACRGTFKMQRNAAKSLNSCSKFVSRYNKPCLSLLASTRVASKIKAHIGLEWALIRPSSALRQPPKAVKFPAFLAVDLARLMPENRDGEQTRVAAMIQGQIVKRAATPVTALCTVKQRVSPLTQIMVDQAARTASESFKVRFSASATAAFVTLPLWMFSPLRRLTSRCSAARP